MFENKYLLSSDEKKQETLEDLDNVCDKLFVKLCNEYGSKTIDKFLEKELVKFSRDEAGEVDKQKLVQIRQKVTSDDDFAQIMYQSVDNRLRGLGAYVKKRISYENEKDMARMDALTGLPNRNGFEDEVEKRLSNIARFENSKSNIEKREGNFWIMMVDIDKFKLVNDTFGHDVGDEILIDLAKIMKNQLRTNDFSARWGGEEFIMIVDEGIGGANDVLAVAERLREAVQKYQFAHGQPLTISIGVSRYDKSGDVLGTRQKADAGLYIAKGETAQIEQLGIELADGQVAPSEDKTRNQIWYHDNISGKYMKYSKR